MKDLISADDINKEIVLNIFRSINESPINHLYQVLGLLFLDESTRTSSSLKSAIIRQGGGWLGIEGVQGSYLNSNQDSIKNTIRSLSNYCDILAIRGDLEREVFNQSHIPTINCGNDLIITPLWGIWISYLLSEIFKKQRLKIGIYGLAGFSPPIKSYYSVLSLFGHSFYEDSILPETSSHADLIELLKRNGSTFHKSNIMDFIKEIDLLIISDCNPERNIDQITLNQYINSYRSVNSELLENFPKTSKIFIVEPFKFAGGKKSTITEDVLSDPRIVNDSFNKISVNANIGIIKYLLS